MSKQYKKTLFIFRRDLRLEDNTGLIKALELSEQVVPCFIFTPEQVGPENTYRSLPAIQFMRESLAELADALRKKGGELYFFYGKTREIIEQLIISEQLSAIMVNRDYTPYSRSRDEEIKKICLHYKIDFILYSDALLREPDEGVSGTGKMYQIFTPFYNKNSSYEVAQPHYSNLAHYATHSITFQKSRSTIDTLLPHTIESFQKGGRSAAQNILNSLKEFREYSTRHNDLSYRTTHLAPHNKFGTVSIREVYHTLAKELGEKNDLIRQLYWRDFFYHIAWFKPDIFGHPFRKQYEDISWNTSTKDFERWCTGTTGFPIVDAGMRELNETGFMHNRARLIVGSFLVKDLHINWQWGERYFAQHLTDYDPCVNNGNWQWVASTGCDAQPYFRIFNPWLQQKKFDPAGDYIRRWVPELRTSDSMTIHTLYKQKTIPKDYYAPMIDHTHEANKTKKLYKKA